MRVAYLLERFPVVSETFILTQMTALAARGHEIIVLAERPSGEPVTHREVSDRSVAQPHYGFSTPGGRTARRLRQGGRLVADVMRGRVSPLRAGRLLQRYGEAGLAAWSFAPLPELVGGFDAIVAHFGTMGLRGAALREADRIGGPLVTCFHGFDMTRIPREQGPGVYRPLFAQGELFLPVSEFWRDRLLGWGADPARTRVLPMGIRLERFPYEPPSPDGVRPLEVLSIARLVEKKGIEFGLQAIARLPELQLRYTIVGEGPLRASLERMVVELGLAGRVRFTGWADQTAVRKLLRGADILLAPSITAADGDQEGIPVVLMEAMAMGVPVVSTTHSGIPELVTDGESGFLVPERDSARLAERILWLASRPECRLGISQAARHRVELQHDAAQLAGRLEGMLRGLSARR